MKRLLLLLAVAAGGCPHSSREACQLACPERVLPLMSASEFSAEAQSFEALKACLQHCTRACPGSCSHNEQSGRRALQGADPGLQAQCLTTTVVDLASTVETLEGQMGSLRDEVDLLKQGYKDMKNCCKNGGGGGDQPAVPKSCSEVPASGTYTIDVDGTQTEVYCDINTNDPGALGGSWVKILQVHDVPIEATPNAYGPISAADVTEGAKLADGIINLMAPPGKRVYRLEGSLTSKKVWIEQEGLFDIDSRGIGLAAVKPFRMKECDTYSSCNYEDTSYGTIDTLHVIGGSPLAGVANDCDRYFIDYSGASSSNRCYNGGNSAEEVCFAAGSICSTASHAGHALIPTVTLWLKVD